MYPRQALLHEEMAEIMAVVCFDKGIVPTRGGASRCESVTGMNGERPGEDPFDVRGRLFAEAYDRGWVFESEMILLFADSLQSASVPAVVSRQST